MGFSVWSRMLRWSPSNFKYLCMAHSHHLFKSNMSPNHSIHMQNPCPTASLSVYVSHSLSPLLNLETGCGHYSNWGEEKRKRRGGRAESPALIQSMSVRSFDSMESVIQIQPNVNLSSSILVFPIIRLYECDFSTWVLISPIFPMSCSWGCGGKRTNWLE